jgi:hypothetical protein
VYTPGLSSGSGTVAVVPLRSTVDGPTRGTTTCWSVSSVTVADPTSIGSLKVRVMAFGVAGSVALAAGSEESSSLWAEALAGSSALARSRAKTRAPTIGVSLVRS